MSGGSVMARPRVVVVDHTGDLGGAEIALARLLPALGAEFATSVVLLADGPFRARLAEDGVPTKLVPLDPGVAGRGRNALLGSPRRLLAAAGEAWRCTGLIAATLRTGDADLVVANSLKAAVLVAVAARRAGRPWVWHLHDRLSADYLPGPVAAVMRMLARVGPRQVVVNSRDTAARLAPIRAARLSVAYPGLPAAAFRTDRTPPEGVVVGMLGRISPTKGQREFVEAAAEVARTHPEVRFRIVGTPMFNDHAYAEAVERRVAELGLADRVELAGWRPDPRAELDALTAVVHASPVPEPFGQVVAEGMARRVPVIATRAGGAAEILDPDGTAPATLAGRPTRTGLGQLVLPGDVAGLAEAIRWVVDEPDAAAALADAAYKSAQARFRIEVTAGVVAAAWRAALAGPSAASVGRFSRHRKKRPTQDGKAGFG